MQLFVERAGAVAPDFDPGTDELAAIAEIVRRLDGLPLAIELAAARLHTLDVAEVAAGLDRRFLLLSSGYRTSTSPRVAQRRGVVVVRPARSDRCNAIFADLSVFAGPFTAAAAAAICGVDVDAATVALDQLVERSLVMRAPERRFVLLETLRAFGAEQLVAAGRAARRGRAPRTSLRRVDRGRRPPACATPGRPRVLTEIDDALPELRTALGWLLDHGEVELAGRLVAAAARLRLPAPPPRRAGVVGAGGGLPIPMTAARWRRLAWAVAAHAAWMAGDLAEHG